ncbi:FmdB family zinc ribbon protein [Cellulosimicrobium marinum]|uniref:FmdB family zinc ribbon protein n=1 Tax=Cellulosimicrobium marinum TaxID=1638992 RepID=UPI001E3A761E|nr:FmdB family zinc ribbon protein [Cellulosimicrobium marinum]MCB7136978.1 FmdB family transcriptional regulator [Cellulosimicrobium marinum]
MPTYAYTCTACGHAFDIHQAFTDDALTVCPECSGRLRKVFSSVGVTFKGSGFYRNDSRAGKGSSSGASSGSSSKTAKGGASSGAAASTSSSGSSTGSSSTGSSAS